MSAFDSQLAMWRIQFSNRDRVGLKHLDLLWVEDYGTEFPHDIQLAIDAFNKETTRARITLKDGLLECRAIVYEDKPEAEFKRQEGVLYCDNCNVVLTKDTRLPRWESLPECVCAYVCSRECGDMIDHRTGNCDCTGLGECRPQWEAWKAEHPDRVVNLHTVYDCLCDC